MEKRAEQCPVCEHLGTRGGEHTRSGDCIYAGPEKRAERVDFDTAAQWFREDEMGEKRAEHTPEPWEVVRGTTIFGGPVDYYVAEVQNHNGSAVNDANAHRIVACVNALAGVEEPEAELARLRVIEAAARAYVEADPDRVDMGPLYDALEQAVGR